MSRAQAPPGGKPAVPDATRDFLVRDLEALLRGVRQWEVDLIYFNDRHPTERLEADPDGGLAAFKEWIKGRLEEVEKP
jgi:hypothetical protein